MNASSFDPAKFTSPLLIPLPPSPPRKVRIPSRKPSGWISSVPRLSSSRFTTLLEERYDSISDQRQSVGSAASAVRASPSGDTEDRQGVRAREISAGTEGTLVDREETAPIGEDRERREEDRVDERSDPRRLRGAGGTRGRGWRRVSGAMQYALLPPLPSPERQPMRSSMDRTSLAADLHLYLRPNESCHVDTVGPPSTANLDLDSEMITTPLPHIHDMPDTLSSVRIVDTRGSSSSDYDANYGIRPGHNDDVEDEYQPDQSFRSVSEISDSDGEDDEGELERPEWLEEVLAERQADEEWMGYVRIQLNALFPDFTTEERYLVDGDQPRSDNVDIGIGSQPERFALLSPQPPFRPGSTYTQPLAYNEALSLRDPVQAGRQAADHLPGVREEMGSLREEIERLRGVVGGLAEGLGKNHQREGLHEKYRSGLMQDSAEKQVSRQEEIDGEDVISDDNEYKAEDVKELLVKNADQVISLLEAIHEFQHPGQEMTTLELLQRDNLVKLQRLMTSGRQRAG